MEHYHGNNSRQKYPETIMSQQWIKDSEAAASIAGVVSEWER
ncbi:hypothetical protein Vi05172_g5020 [Venturia inaequalis]|nr:hypothetical protein Vi05172_g5020 [Venturia inaequalis]